MRDEAEAAVLGNHRLLVLAGAFGVLIAVAIVVAAREGGDSEPVPEALDASFDPAGLQLSPTAADAGGIDPNARFVLTSESPLTAGQVGGALRVQPDAALGIERRSAHEFVLKPARPLAEDTVYRFDFLGQGGLLLAKWAFQVQAPLRVVSTIPDPERANVPLNSGIEITFSHDGVVRPEEFVEISPAAAGHFEQHKRTLVFVPRDLQPFTLYTVTVKPGVTVEGSDLVLADAFVFQFETGSEVRGASLPTQPLAFLSRLNSASTREAPLLNVLSAENREVGVEVYSYPSPDAFLAELDRIEAIPRWASYTLGSFQPDLSQLTRRYGLTLKPESPAGQESRFLSKPFLRFPEALPEGFYLVRILGPAPALAWLQVTDLATYVALGQRDTLVWVNDIATGGPVAAATVERPGKGRVGSTGGDGVAKFQTVDGTIAELDPRSSDSLTGRGYFVVSDRQGRKHVAPLSPVLYTRGRYFASDYVSLSVKGDYWTLLTTDRPVYQPADTVHFWGVARPREGKPEIDIEISITGSDRRGRVKLANARTLRTSSLGTFEGDLSFEGIAPGTYTLEMRHKGERIYSSYFRVDTYAKPAYRISAATDRIAYIAGEEVRLDIRAEFFEGTPVAGLEIELTTASSSPGSAERPHLTTGPDGRVIYTFPAAVRPSGLRGYRDTGFATINLSATPVGPEEAEISGSGAIAVFPADVGLRVNSTYENGAITLFGEAYAIDTSRVSNWNDLYFRPPGDPQGLPAYAGAPVLDQEVSIQITEISYNKVEIGEEYDFISKTVRKVYRYDRIEERVDTQVLRTGGVGQYRYTLWTEEDRTYQIAVSANDAAGRTASLETYAYSRIPRPNPIQGYLDLRFRDETRPFAQPSAFALGEIVTVSLRQSSGEALPAGGINRYLFYEAQRGSLSARVQDRPELDFQFDEARIPSVTLKAVYFNGSTYVEPGPEGTAALTVKFNPQERRLHIELAPEKGEYGPGEDATVSIRVLDDAGKPVKAEVNVAIVDEALFAVRDFSSYQLDVLNRLYQAVPAGLIRTYASHALPQDQSLSAPRTGNGVGDPRDDFEDTADYRTVQTDAGGKATVKLKLPDNLTSWRITAFGLTADLKAGTGQGKLVVKRPFFVDASLNADYLAGDKPYLRVRGFGEALKPGDMVQFEVTAPSLGIAAPLTGQAGAYTGLDLALPTMVEGEHEITIKGISGAYSDILVREVSVVASHLALPEVRFVEDVRSGQDVQAPASGRATVTFVDAGRGAYYDTLSRLAAGRGDRADQAVARVLAGRLLTRYFDDPPRPEDFDPDLYSRQGAADRGVALLPFAGPDLIATARLAALAPDLIGKNAMRPFLQKTADDLNETAERRAIALYGLAALGDPVLDRLRALQDEPQLGWRGRLYAGLGFEAAGDASGARSLFDALGRDFGEDIAPYARLKVGADQDDVVEATALAAVLAAGINDPKADALMRYARDNHTRDLLLILEELDFAQKRLARVPSQSVSFALTIDGQRTDVTLERGRARSFSLSPTELKGLRIEVGDGRLAASVRFSSGVASSQLPSNADLQISRTLTPVDGAAFTRTGLVKVAIEFSIGARAPDGCYQVDDVLPSGLKPVSIYGRAPRVEYRADPASPNVVRTETVIYPYRIEGQRVSFCLHKGSQSPVVYFARPTGAGVFQAEPALFFNQNAPDVITTSRSQLISIE